MERFVVVFAFFTILNGFCITLTRSKNQSITDVVNAVAKIIEYFKNNYQSLNFEAHFGLRVIEGQLKLLLAEYDEGKHRSVPANAMTHLRYLAGEAMKVANMAVPHLLDFDRRAFSSMRYQVEKPWSIFHSHRLVDSNLTWDRNSMVKRNEISDEDRNTCIGELTGLNNKERHKCATTLNCLEMMTARGHRGFSLQHQIFYTASAEQVGCKNTLEDYLHQRTPKMSLDQLQQEFCSNAYFDLLKTAENYGIQPSYINLLLLMEFNCPSLGFFQFLTNDILELILSWQSSNGCISNGGVGDQVPEPPVPTHQKLPSRLIVQQEEHQKPKEIVIGGDHQNQYPEHPAIETKNGNVQPGSIQLNHNINPQNTYNGNWPPNQKIQYENYVQQNQDQHIINPNAMNDHQHDVMLSGGANEIAHGHPNDIEHNQNELPGNQHDALDVQEVVHNRNPYFHNNVIIPHEAYKLQNNLHQLYPQLQKEIGNYNEHENHQQRNLLQVQQQPTTKEDEDHGYFFDREKHIGGNSSERHIYLYYYPMYEQMKRINDAKERQQLKRAERRKKLHLMQLSTTRKLLKDSTGGCHMEMTGLTACVLTMYIRFIIDPGPPQFHNLRLNKPEGQYDLGNNRESLEGDEPDEPLYVPEKSRNYIANAVNNVNEAPANVLRPLPGGFKPLYFGDVRKKLHPEEDDEYVRKAESPKVLIDRAFDIHKPSTTRKNSQKPIERSLPKIEEKNVNAQTQNKSLFFNSFFDKNINISPFHNHLPTELGFNLFIVVIISLVCVYVMFRYLRFKKRVRYRTKYI